MEEVRKLKEAIRDRYCKTSEAKAFVGRLIDAGETHPLELLVRAIGSGINEELAIDVISSLLAKRIR